MTVLTSASSPAQAAVEQIGVRPAACKERVLRGLGGPAAGRVGVVALALLLVALQPWGEPWWYTADSDGGHLANGLNLLLGHPTKLLDHPALPMQALLTLSLQADYLVHGWWQGVGVRAYVDACFADPDRIIGHAAFWGLTFLLAAVVVAFEVGARLFGHWQWGIVAAMLYLALPGHLAFATMIRPENILSASCLLAAYLLWRALEQRSPSRCLVAAGLIGHAVSEKVHAIGLFVPLGVTVLALGNTDWIAHSVHTWRKGWTRYRGTLLAGTAVWLGCVVVLNTGREPAALDWKIFAALGLGGFYLATAAQAGKLRGRLAPLRWLAHPAYVLTVGAVLVGLVLPSALLLDELRPLLWQLMRLVRGGGVNTGMSAGGVLNGVAVVTQRSLDTLVWPLLIPAAMGAARSIAARRWADGIWVVAAAGMLMPALARSSVAPSPHYLAPTFVLLIPLVMGALRPARAEAGAPPRRWAWATAAILVVGPYVLATQGTWANVARAEKIAAVSNNVLARLQPGEAVLMNYGAMNAEANAYRQLVDYAIYAPFLPLHCFPDIPNGLAECRRRGLRPAYYVGAPGPGSLRFEGDASGWGTLTNAWGERFEAEAAGSFPGAPILLEVYRIREISCR